MLAAHHVLRRAVIPALQLGDPPPAGESSARARTAIMTASVPELVNRTRSSEPIRSTRCRANRSWASVGPGKQVPSSSSSPDRLHHRRRAVSVNQNRSDCR